MSEIRLEVDSAQALWAFERAPDVMARYVGLGTREGAEVVTAAAKENSSESGGFADVFGALRNSIRTYVTEGLPEGNIGHESRASVKYAAWVEEGTGPAAGHARYYPNQDALLAVLRNSPRSRGYKWARKGSKKRARQDEELIQRSRAWALSIFVHGTKPHPFMAPAAVRSEARVREVVGAWIGRGIAEVFGGAG